MAIGLETPESPLRQGRGPELSLVSPQWAPQLKQPQKSPSLCEVTPPYSRQDLVSRPPSSRRALHVEFLLIYILSGLLGLQCPAQPILERFIKATLVRSGASTEVLRISLIYLYYIYVHTRGAKHSSSHKKPPCLCFRKCWLSCLILASKYHEDCNFTFKAWSKLTGLPMAELCSNELKVLETLDFNVSVDVALYDCLFSTSFLTHQGMPATGPAALARLFGSLRGSAHATSRARGFVQSKRVHHHRSISI